MSSQANTPVPPPIVVKFSTSTQYVWTSPANTPFNGFALIELIPPTDGTTAYSFCDYYNLGPSITLPNWSQIPVVNGYLDASSGLFANSQMVPPNSKYRFYWYDATGRQISGPSSNFTVATTDSTVNLPTLPITAPTLTGTTTNPDSFIVNNVPSSQGIITNGVNTVTFSTTPVFDLSLGNQYITLTSNVVSSTITNLQAGQNYTFYIKQDSTGGWTFVWPTNMKGTMTIGSIAGDLNVQTFNSPDGINLYATSTGGINQG